ncbi:glycerophosphodiester phosphodiesterase family protein [Hymenobacter sp. B81]|uniref:glycerophosphodiester phosphodiesterase family protein n=1 Tax=Hymenobacter sp. B81 TaxID=3344878 RepID=UPI0037DDAFCF
MPRVYGHRGCRGLLPENTLPAFLHALQWPISGLELDVVLSADGQVVVSHEPWLNHLICRGPQGELLSEAEGRAFNLYQQPYSRIRRCDCGQLRHPRFPRQQTLSAPKPLLREVLAAVEAHARQRTLPPPEFCIEIKSTPVGDGVFHPAPEPFAAAVLACLTELRPASPITLLSFDHRVLQALRRQAPAWPLCLLIEDHQPVAEHLAQLGFQPDSLGIHHPLIDAPLMRFCQQHQLPVTAWTVNTATEVQRLTALGVQALTTDYPDLVTAVLGL